MNPALRSLPDGSLPALDGPIDAVFLGDVVTEDRVISVSYTHLTLPTTERV